MNTIYPDIGDTVSHKTLGEGFVTAVDDRFCTVAFASKKAMFRHPHAFEKGWLTLTCKAQTEETTPGEETAPAPAAALSPAPEAATESISCAQEATEKQEEQLGCVSLMLVYGLPMSFFGPIIYFCIDSFFLDYKIDSEYHYIYALPVAMSLVFMIVSIRALRRWFKRTPVDKEDSTLTHNDDSSGTSTLLTGIMLSSLLHNAGKDHNSIFDDARDDLFWQEKYHRDHR